MNNWYITAYEPIENINHQIIGILYVGILEQKYVDIKQQTLITFLAITLWRAWFPWYWLITSPGVSLVPSNNLVSASGEVARGNLETRVEINSTDELGN